MCFKNKYIFKKRKVLRIVPPSTFKQSLLRRIISSSSSNFPSKSFSVSKVVIVHCLPRQCFKPSLKGKYTNDMVRASLRFCNPIQCDLLLTKTFCQYIIQPVSFCERQFGIIIVVHNFNQGSKFFKRFNNSSLLSEICQID